MENSSNIIQLPNHEEILKKNISKIDEEINALKQKRKELENELNVFKIPKLVDEWLEKIPFPIPERDKLYSIFVNGLKSIPEVSNNFEENRKSYKPPVHQINIEFIWENKKVSYIFLRCEDECKTYLMINDDLSEYYHDLCDDFDNLNWEQLEELDDICKIIIIIRYLGWESDN